MGMCLELFSAFFRVGLFTFGGGYAMLPLLERECVEKKKWTTREELLDYFAIGQCTPGIIAVNTATFVGCKKKGFWGGLSATLGVVSPSIIIISLIAALLQNFAKIPAVINAFAGIRVAVCVLILNSVVKLWKSSVKDALTLGVFLAVFLLSVILTGENPILFVLAAALLGIAARVWFAGKGEKK